MSEAWGGRTSGKYLTKNCGFLEHLLPGDMAMVDRGFTIAESVGLKQAKLVIPAFTKRKSQLNPVDVEKNKGNCKCAYPCGASDRIVTTQVHYFRRNTTN